MSDRTSATLIVYSIPADKPEQVRAIVDMIEEYDLDEYGQVGETLPLGEAFTVGEVTCGSADQMSKWLRNYAPDATWTVWEDPAYQWLGDLHRYAPHLGLHRSDCDAEGRPVFTDQQVTEAMGDISKLAELIGLPWRAVLDAARQVAEGRSVPVPASSVDA